MSKRKINKDTLYCQLASSGAVVDKYQQLMTISTKHKSPALFAGVNQAKRLLLKCNRLKREIEVICKHTGFWSKLLLKNKLRKMKAVYEFHANKLESWLDSFMLHFSFKYSL